MKGFDQRTPYHVHDVLEHTARVVDATPPQPLVRWAALFHDMGKPALFFADARGVGHFYGHPASARRWPAGRWRGSRSPRRSPHGARMVRRHDDALSPTRSRCAGRLRALAATSSCPRAVRPQRGDAAGQAPFCRSRIEEVDAVEALLDDILAADEAFSLGQLAVDGRTVLALGAEPGPIVDTRSTRRSTP